MLSTTLQHKKSVFKEEKRGIFKEKCISVDKTCKAFEAVWSYEIISKCWIFLVKNSFVIRVEFMDLHNTHTDR